MLERRSLRWPIFLGVTLIVLLVALTVGWVLLSVFAAHWILLTVGTLLFVVVLTGVIAYLTLTVKAINLNQRQSNFMDSVTHELKSPLASLKLYLQTLNRHAVDKEQAASFYRFMLDDVERLDQLINQLLDAARLDRKPSATDIEDIELDTLLRECVDAVALRYRVSPETIRLSAEPSTVHARRSDLDMIFRNLIDNAVKYANDDAPEISVTCRVQPLSWVEVRIADNGRGIPPVARRRIFGRFVRLGSELERDKPGTGLGLYIVGTLVRRLRGKVQVNDRTPPPGTEMIVLLPGERREES